MNFITLYDKNYMSRGLVLYESLKKHCPNFTMFVLAMDDVVAGYLGSLGYGNLRVITLDDIKEMYPVLVRLEKERTRGEFSWTLSSFSIQYALRKFDLESCIYVDSDICFYNNPELLVMECGEKSVLITEHNYTPRYDQSATSGKFCVQFMYFKNDTGGNEVLEYWRSECEKWCYDRMENGKFGDQKYLDDWENRFDGIVYNCRNIGCGVAPWNIQKYDASAEDGIYYVTERVTKIKKPVVFFHYHALIETAERKWVLSQYKLSENAKRLFYLPYIKTLYEQEQTYPVGLVNKKYRNPYRDSRLSVLRCLCSYLRRFKEYEEDRFMWKSNEIELDKAVII